jgi:hypothetical protein
VLAAQNLALNYPALMGAEHNGLHRQTTAGAHPHLYDATTGEIPRFKRKAKYEAPRYAFLLAGLWLASFIGAVLHLIQGIHGADPNQWDTHHLGDALVLLVLFIVTCCLWNSWEREERYPELLPKREFERRYPPSSAAPPAPEVRPFHRRLIYTDDVTQTGTTIPEPLRRTEYPND